MARSVPLGPLDPIFDNETYFGSLFAPPSDPGVAGVTVTINVAAGQDDPTSDEPILFDILFSEAVSGFTDSDVFVSGTANPTTVNVTGSGDTYTAEVTGMDDSGTVVAIVPAWAAFSVATGLPNSASTSTDNSVDFVLPLNYIYLWDFSDSGTVTFSGPRIDTITDSIAGVVLTQLNGSSPNVMDDINGIDAYFTNAIAANDWNGGFGGSLPTGFSRPYTIVAVVMSNSNSPTFGDAYLGDTSTNSQTRPNIVDINGTIQFGESSLQFSSSANVAYAIMGIDDGASSEVWVNGVQVDTGTLSLPGASSGAFNLGNTSIPNLLSLGGRAWTGWIGLYGIATGVPTSGQITAWFNDVMAKYSI